MKQTFFVLLTVFFFATSTVRAQSDWIHIDCFAEFEPEIGNGPFNLQSTNVYLDNNGKPWTLVSLSDNSFPKLGRTINGQWVYNELPLELTFPFPLSDMQLGSIVFDDFNMPWVFSGSFPFPLITEAVFVFQNDSLTGIANSDWVEAMEKFDGDPFIYLFSSSKVVRVDPSFPDFQTVIYQQPNAAVPIRHIAKGINDDLFIFKQNAQADSLLVIDSQSGMTWYDLSVGFNQFPDNNPGSDMGVSSDGNVWFYSSSGYVHSLMKFDLIDFETYRNYSPNTGMKGEF